jgi:predicted MPP superfamily phosphohydrolase
MNAFSWQSLVFALLFTSVFSAMQFYMWKRLVADAVHKAVWRRLLTALIVAMGLGTVVVMAVSRLAIAERAKMWTFLPLVWMGASLLFVFALLFVDSARILHFLFRRWRSRKDTTPAGEKKSAHDPDRRQFIRRLSAGTTALAVVGASGVAVTGGLRKPTIIRQDIRLEKFPSSMSGLRVVQLSDLHIGLSLTQAWLTDVVARVNALQPDIVVITGDLVDGAVAHLAEHIAPLAGLRATHGVFVVTGNHEYYSDVTTWLPHFSSLGLRVLRNERVRISHGDEFFYLVGVNDYNAGRIIPEEAPDLDRALRGAQDAAAVVLLAHQPREIENARRHGVGLMLSGHTHGGQIWPFSLLVRLQQPFNKGWYRDASGTQVYVNQGTGFWGPPMRLGTESEITLLTLMHADT